jgi:hypothetical protein
MAIVQDTNQLTTLGLYFCKYTIMTSIVLIKWQRYRTQELKRDVVQK